MRMRVFISTIGLLAGCALGADAQNAPQDLLANAEHRVGGFLELISDVKCTERVSQEKLSKNGKVEYREQSQFDYLVIATGSDADLTIQESRLEEHGAVHKKNVPLLISNGFATLILVFHPYYRSGFEFSEPMPVIVEGRSLFQINFRHIAGKRTPMVLVLRGREYPLELSGSAWIDASSGNFVRIIAKLSEPMDDIGLHVLNSEVVYGPVNFRDVDAPSWLPSVARVDVETPRQHWRNTHQFSNYQHFGVDTHATVAAPSESGGTTK